MSPAPTSPRTVGPEATGIRPSGLTRPLLLTLALLSAVAPFGTDMYLSSFPTMATDLGVSNTTVQLTLTAFLIGLAAGPFVFGPLSDRLGRRGPLLIGSLLFVLAGIVAVISPNAGVLIAARFLQGLGGAAGMVIGRAIVTDVAAGTVAARAFSMLMIVGGVAPVAAPILGSVLAAPIGWRGILAVVLGIGVVMLIATLLVVRETRPAGRLAGGVSLRESAHELRDGQFVGYTTVFVFAFATMMAYISASPFLYEDLMGLSEFHYALLFGVNALFLAGVSAFAVRAADRLDLAVMVRAGVIAVLAASVVLLLLVASSAPVGLYEVPILVSVASLGLVFGNATALALAPIREASGAASAVLGGVQFALAAAVAPLVSLGGSDNAWALAIVMCVTAGVATVALLVTQRRAHAQDGPLLSS